MEAQMESGFDRQRLIVPSIIVAVLVVALSAGIYLNGKRKRSAESGKENAAAAGSAAGAAAGKGKAKDSKDEKAPVPVSIASVGTASVSAYLTSTANLVAENEVKIVSESEGRVSRLLVEEGQLVQKGQPLAMINREDAEIALAKAEVRAKNARVSWRRADELMKQQLISRGDYDKTTLEKEVAEQELAEAQYLLGKTTIRAPFSGRVTERNIQAGQHVQPGNTLFTVTAYDPLIARIYLPEKDVMTLRTGQEVRITMKAAESIRFKGRIRQVSPVVDPSTGTVKLTVEAVEPPPAVRPGSFVSIDIVRETHASSVVLPREAVIRELQDAHVFIANGNVAQKRAVSLGIEEGDVVEVLKGVRPGEKVIVAGQGGLRDGSPIKLIPAKG